jgi:ABC-2 type transport system permease protein
MKQNKKSRRYAVIFHKDIDEFRSNLLITIPLFILPVVMAVVLPVVTIYPISNMDMSNYSIDTERLENTSIHSPIPIESLSPKGLLVVLVLNAFVPFFMIIPAVIPSVIAAHSFVGEKNHRTLEALLATPITESELLIGKALSAFIPSILASYLAFAMFCICTDILTYPVFGAYVLPDLFWLSLVGILTPLIATLSIVSNILISTKVSDVRAAQQLGSLVIVPVIVVFVLSGVRIVYIDAFMLYIFAIIIALLDFLIGFIAVKTFKREKILLGRW